MHTKASLKTDLKAMGIGSGDTLFIHSSMKSIGKVENGADTVLDALSEGVEQGLLLLPAHTWSYINAENPLFDVRTSPVCVGLLPELFRSRKGVVRSLHPTHSVSALGADGADYVKGEELLNTPCAPSSLYGRLVQRDAKILLIGVDFAVNTTVHCIEEAADVPGRLSKGQEALLSVDYEGAVHRVPSFRHENANSYYYRKLEPVFLKKGKIKRTHFGDASCLLFSAQDLFSVTLELLSKDILLFENDAPVPQNWY